MDAQIRYDLTTVKRGKFHNPAVSQVSIDIKLAVTCNCHTVVQQNAISRKYRNIQLNYN